MSKKHKNEIRLFCISKCNHMSVYDLLNNTVICSDDTVKVIGLACAIRIIRLGNKVIMA